MVPGDGRNNRTRPTAFRSRWVVAVGCAVLAVAGCKSKGGGGSTRGGDPLLGGASIPPQDLPIPGRGDAVGRADPLLDGGRQATPTSGTDRTGTTPKSKAGDSATLPPPPLPNGPQSKAPPPPGGYRPDRGAATAALAPLPTDDSSLSAGRRPPPQPLTPANGGIPASIPGAGRSFDQIAAELRQYGATWTPPASEGGQYVFRCDLPVKGGQPGQMRRYEGVGASPAAAARQVLAEVRADYPKP